MAADLFQIWGGDLIVDASGDLLSVGGSSPESDPIANLANQRIIRRLLTNPGEYIWQPGYGAGLARFIGQPLNIRVLTALVQSQIFLESAVAKIPAPTIRFATDKAGLVICSITYADSTTGQATPLQFPISP